MKSNVWAIMKKECIRFFGDKRLLFTAIILPGLMIYIMYNLMGNLMSNFDTTPEDYTYQIHVINMPQSIKTIISQSDYGFDIINENINDLEKIKTQVKNMETDLLVVFPENFDALVAEYEVSSGKTAPNIQIWSNSARTESLTANSTFLSILYSYENSLINKFDINAVTEETMDEGYELASSEDMFNSYFVYMLPMLLIMFICVGCQAITPESIAGEKERGTLGTILVTPAKRSDIALAKIFSVTIFGLLGGAGSFIGLILSLPKIMQLDNSEMLNFYSIKDYALIFIISLSTVLVFVSILSLLSAFAKSIKEATSYAMPVMLVSIVCGFSSMITGGVAKEFYYYMIPVFNSAQCMTAIFKHEASVTTILITTAANIVFMLICTFILTRMFNSEKIIFDK